MTDLRIVSLGGDWPQAGPGWQMRAAGANLAQISADLVLVPADSAIDDAAIDQLALPVLVGLGAAAPSPRWLDRADGYVLPGDDGAAIAAVARGIVAAARPWGVAEQSDAAQLLSGLSSEAQRLADALSRLAQQSDDPGHTPVSAAMVRRLIRLRRDRDRHFPADLFADPAWDMLLDLAAARMEGADVAVSSLCVAAAVPTTTALRWVRSLSHAGIFVRRTDPMDARRAFIGLSDEAFDAVAAWLRRFAAAFQLR